MANGGIKTLDDALKAVAQVGPVAREYCQKAEDIRQLPVEVVDAMYDTGLWSVFAPKAVGGAGLMGLVPQFEIIRALAYEDTSAAWALFICGTGPGIIASKLSDEGRAEVFADGPAPMAGVLNPGGSAQLTDGGVTVSGRWPFASGINYAKWVLLNCILTDESGAPRPGIGPLPELRGVVVRPDEITVVDDWHVAGLRGTGSMTIMADKIFVPEHRTLSVLAPPVLDDPVYKLPPFSLFAPNFAGLGVGLAERALDEVASVLPTRVGPPTFTPASEDPVNQTIVGKASAAVRAARESTRAIYEKYDQRVAAGEDLSVPTVPERVEIHQHAIWALETCRETVNELFRLGGANAIYEPGALQRAWRDINVVNQHVYARGVNHQHAGKAVLGIEVNTPLL